MKSLTALLFALAAAASNPGVSPSQLSEFVARGSYLDAEFFHEQQAIYQEVARAPAPEQLKTAARVLAQRWKLPEATVSELIEAVVLQNLDHETVNRKARIAQIYRDATRDQPESPEVWGLAVLYSDQQEGCKNARLR